MLKGNEVVIPATARHKELAWEFMKFLAGEEAQYLYGLRGRFFPVNRNAALRLVREWSRSNLRPEHMLILTTANIRSLPLRPGFQEINNMWIAELEPVWAGQKPAREATIRINELVDTILAKY